MSQKQAKRLRRIEQDIAELYIAQSKTVFLVGNLAAKFPQATKPTAWRRLLQTFLHRDGG